MKVKVEINHNECLGCSFCESVLPELFKLDENIFKGKLKEGNNLKDSIVFEANEDQFIKLKNAAEGCPVHAINIEEQK